MPGASDLDEAQSEQCRELRIHDADFCTVINEGRLLRPASLDVHIRGQNMYVGANEKLVSFFQIFQRVFESCSRGDFMMFVFKHVWSQGSFDPRPHCMFYNQLVLLVHLGPTRKFEIVLRVLFESKAFVTFMRVQMFVQVEFFLLH